MLGRTLIAFVLVRAVYWHKLRYSVSKQFFVIHVPYVVYHCSGRTSSCHVTVISQTNKYGYALVELRTDLHVNVLVELVYN